MGSQTRMWRAPGLNGSAPGPLCKVMTISLVLCGSSCTSDSFAFWVALSSPKVSVFACLIISCFVLLAVLSWRPVLFRRGNGKWILKRREVGGVEGMGARRNCGGDILYKKNLFFIKKNSYYLFAFLVHLFGNSFSTLLPRSDLYP